MPYSVRCKRAAALELEAANSWFYVIERSQVIVPAFMHQHLIPRTREELVKP